MIEHLFDEALVWALRRGATALVERPPEAKMTEEIGLAQPVEYTEEEKRTIATHEAGHATVAWLVARVASWRCSRSSSAGTRWVCSPTPRPRSASPRPESELRALIQIAFGGMVAEELFFGESSTGLAGDLRRPPSAPADGRPDGHGIDAGLGSCP